MSCHSRKNSSLSHCSNLATCLGFLIYRLSGTSYTLKICSMTSIVIYSISRSIYSVLFSHSTLFSFLFLCIPYLLIHIIFLLILFYSPNSQCSLNNLSHFEDLMLGFDENHSQAHKASSNSHSLSYCHKCSCC